MSGSSIQKPLQWWQDQLYSRVTNAAPALLDAEILRALNEFCRISTAWRTPVTRRTAVPSQLLIDTNPVDERRIALGVLKVFYKGRELPYTADLLRFQGYAKRGTGDPSMWTGSQDDQGAFYVDAAPATAQSQAYDALVYCAPKCPDAWLPSILTTNYREAVLEYALGMTLMHDKRPYSNPVLAAMHLKRGRALAVEARTQADMGRTPGGVNWAFPRFGQ